MHANPTHSPDPSPDRPIDDRQLPRVIALVGCTGSGKTGLGVALAKAIDAEILSVDSMAVYRGMDIGTAKPSRQEQDGVPHHLLDVVNPDEPFTAADFVRLARPILSRLHAEGRPALLVGGTGLYLRALLHGLFEGPASDPEFRQQALEQSQLEEARGVPHPLHQRLETVDSAAALRLHPRDHVRILRALEVFHQTGRPLSLWQAEHAFAEQPYRWVKLAVELPRETLYSRIDARVLTMVGRGMEAETAGLIRHYGTDVKPMKGLGYLHFTRVLRGEWTHEEAVTALQRDTRRFARRQITWFRGEPGIRWIPPDLATLLEAARTFLASNSC